MTLDLKRDNAEVNTESENYENNSNVLESGKPAFGSFPKPKHPIGPSGNPNELQDIRAALKEISSESRFSRQAVANHLQRFFGPEHDAHGKSLFVKWVAEQLPIEADDIEPEELAALWRDERSSNPQPALTLPKLLEALYQTARNVCTEAVAWPEPAAPNSSAPRPRSQKNIARLLHEIGATVYRNEFSGRNHIEGFESFDELDDDAITALWLRGDRMGLQPSIDYFSSVIRDIARQNARNPVKDFFRSVTWDKTPRLDSWLIDYAGAANTELNREFGKLWLIAAVRRVRKPGTKFDQILILEGEQGAGKSSLARILANAVGPGLFEDGLQLGAETRQVIEATRSKLIVEISELRGNNRDVEAVKAMLSRIEDSARLAYGRETSHVPRQFVMIGTTNSSEYLVDPTGNRRFWPVKVGKIDLKRLAENAPQLWAEAALREAEGAEIQLPETLWSDAATEQSERVIGDPICEAIAAELGDDGGEVTMDALFTMIGLGKDKIDRRNRAAQTSIGRAMAQIPGWQRQRRTIAGQRVYFYEKRVDEDGRYVWSVGPGGDIRKDRYLGSGPEKVVPFTSGRRRAGDPAALPAPPPALPTEPR